MNLRSLLYKSARILGDINAVQRGPSAILKRAGRKVAARGIFSLLGKLFK